MTYLMNPLLANEEPWFCSCMYDPAPVAPADAADSLLVLFLLSVDLYPVSAELIVIIVEPLLIVPTSSE